MGNPSYEHLEPGEMMEYLDGSLDAFRVRTHLRQCAQCRAELRELVLVQVLLSPPEQSPRRSHVPPDTLASYVEDRLTMEQNRAVEDHFTRCARCLTDYLELKKSLAAEPEAAVPPELSAQVLSRLEAWRTRKPVGILFVRRFMDQVGLVFKPSRKPSRVDDYTEHVAGNNFPFGRQGDRPAIPMPARLMWREEYSGAKASESIGPRMYHADIRRGHFELLIPQEASILAGDAWIRLTIQEKEGTNLLTVEVVGGTEEQAQPGIRMELLVKSEISDVQETDQEGRATFRLPHSPSALLVHLKETYEIEIEANV